MDWLREGSDVTCFDVVPDCWISQFPFFFLGTSDGYLHVFKEDLTKMCEYPLLVPPFKAKPKSEKKSSKLDACPTMLFCNPSVPNEVLIIIENENTSADGHHCVICLFEFKAGEITRSFDVLIPTGANIDENFSISSACWHPDGDFFLVGFNNPSFLAVYSNANGQTRPFLYQINNSIENATVKYRPILNLQWNRIEQNCPLSGCIMFTGGNVASHPDYTTVFSPPPTSAETKHSSKKSNKSENSGLLSLYPSSKASNDASTFPWDVFFYYFEKSRKIDIYTMEFHCTDCTWCIYLLCGCPLDGISPFFVSIPIKDKNNSQLWDDCKPLLPCYSKITQEVCNFEVINLQCDYGRTHRILRNNNTMQNDGNINEENSLIGSKETFLLTSHESGVIKLWNLIPPQAVDSIGTPFHCLSTFSIQESSLAETASFSNEIDGKKKISISVMKICINCKILLIGLSNGQILLYSINAEEDSKTSVFELLSEYHIHACSVDIVQILNCCDSIIESEDNQNQLQHELSIIAADEFGCVSVCALTFSINEEKKKSLLDITHELIVFDVSFDPEKAVTFIQIMMLRGMQFVIIGRGNGEFNIFHENKHFATLDIFTKEPYNTFGSGFYFIKQLSTQNTNSYSCSHSPEELVEDIPWSSLKAIEVTLNSGVLGKTLRLISSVKQDKYLMNLGLDLDEKIRRNAVVKGYTSRTNETGLKNQEILKANGVEAGFVIKQINGKDVHHEAAIKELSGDGLSVKVMFLDTREYVDVLPKLEYLNDTIDDNAWIGCIGVNLIVFDFSKQLLKGVEQFLEKKGVDPNEKNNQESKVDLDPINLHAHEVMASKPLLVDIVDIPVGEKLQQFVVTVENCGEITIYSLLDDQNKILSRISHKLLNFDSHCNNEYISDFKQIALSSMAELITLNSSTMEMQRFSLLNPDIQRELNCLYYQPSIDLPDSIMVDKDNEIEPKECKDVQPVDLKEYKDQQKRKKSIFGTKILDFVGSIGSGRTKKQRQAINLTEVFENCYNVEKKERELLLGGCKERQENMQKKKPMEGSFNQTKQALHQASENLQLRGNKLSELAEKTEEMKRTSEDFYHTMKKFNEKEQAKKWWDF